MPQLVTDSVYNLEFYLSEKYDQAKIRGTANKILLSGR